MADKIKYRYALDEQGRTVCIDDVCENDKKLHTYYCIGCGATMIARTGKIKKWHFAHKGTEEHCNPETYLHKLAKRLVMDKFYNTNSFEVSYWQDVKCSLLQTCAFAEKYNCHCKMLKTYDLKKYYDTCKEEQPIDNFVADLLLTNSENADRKPILIEIQVTHECEEQKKNSGLRIIELRIEDENVIKDLLKTSLKENASADRDIDTIGFAKFYNFERKCKEPEPIEVKNLKKFLLEKSGYSEIESIGCSHYSTKKNYGNDTFEVFIDERHDLWAYQYGLLLAIQRGFITRACCFCKNYYNIDFNVRFRDTNKFCHKYGEPKNPSLTYAQQCNNYSEDKELIMETQYSLPTTIIPWEFECPPD